MNHDEQRLQEAKEKTHKINQSLVELNTFIKSAEGISPLMKYAIEEKIDGILIKTVQLLRITKK